MLQSATTTSPVMSPPTFIAGGTQSSSSAFGVNFTTQEHQHYHQLFSIADAEGRGVLEGLQAANQLRASGLDQGMLHRIWEIADSSNQGWLTREGFYVALRLVAHAQAGHELAHALVMREPPALPDLEGLLRNRGSSECSPMGSLSPASGYQAPSEMSEFQPVISASQPDLHRSPSVVRTPRGGPRWAPSLRELRKYASLFLKTDQNHDGYVEAAEAKAVLQRSGLENELLMAAWEHSDRDRDGRLTFPEFIVLVHLVTCCVKRGAAMPGLEEGLPLDLLNALAALEPSPEALAAQRSRSPSPISGPRTSPPSSHIPEPPPLPPACNTIFAQPFSGSWTPDPPELARPSQGFPTPPIQTTQNDAGWSGESSCDEQLTPVLGGESAANNVLEDWTMNESFAPPPPSEKRESRKNRRHRERTKEDHEDEGFSPEVWPATPGTTATPDQSSRRVMPHTEVVQVGQQVRHDDDERDDYVERTVPVLPRESQDEVDAAIAQFEAAVDNDREVLRRIQIEVDEREDELQQVREALLQFQRQVQSAQRDGEHLLDQRRQLDRKVADMKDQLSELHDARRSMNLKSVSIRRDCAHFMGELRFLQNMSEQEERSLETLRSSNQILEKACRSLEVHIEQLERQRKEVIVQVAQDKDIVRQEERYNAEMRNQVERMQREKAAAAAGRREAHLRESKLREMQSHGPERLPVSDGRPRHPQLIEGHSWAHQLMTIAPARSADHHASSVGADINAGVPMRHDREGV